MGHVQRIKIAIAPELKESFGPEICWTWRLLLSGIGLSWEEVALDDPDCDIAYVVHSERQYHARFFVTANPRSWEQRGDRRLRNVERQNGFAYPCFQDDSFHPDLIRAANGCLACQRDLIFDVFWLATGQEEQYWPKNKHGHFDLAGTVVQQEQALRLAMGSSIGCFLEKIFVSLGFPASIPRWPHGKRAAAAVGHDVDYPEIIKWLEPLRVLARQGLRGLPAAAALLRGKRKHWHFLSWAEMERILDTRSAFYFVARQGSLFEYALGTPDPFYDVRSRRFRKLFADLTEKGFEIGLHASYRAYENCEQFAAEKQALEEASAQSIRGNRHHYWHLSPDDPESTLLLHERIGLQYDTSLIHDRYVGWRRGLCWPFFPFHQQERRELKTLQIPTAWMDDHLFGHRKDNPGDRMEILHALADRAADQGGCLLVDVHDYVFDEVLFPEWAGTYRGLWEYLIARADFWVDTPHRIAEHWIRRYSALQQASRGLTNTAGHS